MQTLDAPLKSILEQVTFQPIFYCKRWDSKLQVCSYHSKQNKNKHLQKQTYQNKHLQWI